MDRLTYDCQPFLFEVILFRRHLCLNYVQNETSALRGSMSKFTIPKILFENLVMKKADKLLLRFPSFELLKNFAVESENYNTDEMKANIEILFKNFDEERILKLKWVQDNSDGAVSKEIASLQDLIKKLGADKKFIKYFENLATYNKTLAEIGFLGPIKTIEDIFNEFTDIANIFINPTSVIKIDSTVPLSSCFIVILDSFFVLIEISLASERNLGGEVFPIKTSPPATSSSGETIPSSSKNL